MSFWILMACVASGCIGFLTFALMQVARDADRGQEIDPASHVPHH